MSKPKPKPKPGQIWKLPGLTPIYHLVLEVVYGERIEESYAKCYVMKKSSNNGFSLTHVNIPLCHINKNFDTVDLELLADVNDEQ